MSPDNDDEMCWAGQSGSRVGFSGSPVYNIRYVLIGNFC